MSTVAAMLVRIMLLYSCVSYTFAAVGMAIFADAKSDLLEPRWGGGMRTIVRALLVWCAPKETVPVTAVCRGGGHRMNDSCSCSV